MALVAIETDGRVDLDELAGTLADAGARDVRVETGMGDDSAGVLRYFIFQFELDGVSRSAKGFHAHSCDRNENGWTRLQLGADASASAMIGQIGERLGGWIDDGWTWTVRTCEAEPAYMPGMR